jgi:hypothetical protein
MNLMDSHQANTDLMPKCPHEFPDVTGGCTKVAGHTGFHASRPYLTVATAPVAAVPVVGGEDKQQ